MRNRTHNLPRPSVFLRRRLYRYATLASVQRYGIDHIWILSGNQITALAPNSWTRLRSVQSLHLPDYQIASVKKKKNGLKGLAKQISPRLFDVVTGASLHVNTSFPYFLTCLWIAALLATQTTWHGLGSRPLDVDAGAPLQADTGWPPALTRTPGFHTWLKLTREQSKIASYLFETPVVKNPS